ncbi:hypothetical protein B0H17DRAFT_1195307 [Mycena rosella]|uniref:RING-type domain-containing protein n=1 Tax=Mycena rosella TaxID=1033263 RepID=A0AAD7GPM9_MYCRO|nr:hypothetical protein B0H17DRAFT_1195307 [Mycena rosella]
MHVITPFERDRRRNGYQPPLNSPLLVKELYVDGILPTPLKTNNPDHTCSLCSHVKSHPVIYNCYHSHCYACICQRLEDNWTCPTCSALIKRAPRRNHDEEHAIAQLFLAWAVATRVAYFWTGLILPRPAQVIVPCSDKSS